MSKDPAVLWYPNDWIGGTMGMSLEEKGAYMELLMLQFNRGHMNEHMIQHMIGQLWENIKSKFVQDENGLWFNVRLDEEKNKRSSYTKSRSSNRKGKISAQQNNDMNNDMSKHMNSDMKKHMSSHMENENENINNISFNNINCFNHYMRYINPTPSENVRNMLSGFLDDGMTDEAIIAVIDYCRDEKKTNWSYMRTTLQRLYASGVRTRDDYDRNQTEHLERKANSPPVDSKETPAERFEREHGEEYKKLKEEWADV